MNSTGIVITYVERTYDGRLVGFTATPAEPTGAPSRQSDNYTFTLIVVLACVLGPLIIVIIIITIVILVVHKVCRISFLFLIIFGPTAKYFIVVSV